MTVPPRLAMLFAEQSSLCRIYSINKVAVVVVEKIANNKLLIRSQNMDPPPIPQPHPKLNRVNSCEKPCELLLE